MRNNIRSRCSQTRGHNLPGCEPPVFSPNGEIEYIPTNVTQISQQEAEQ
nr:MAG TPA: hypothetical protein [Bacteriophage sp.]